MIATGLVMGIALLLNVRWLPWWLGGSAVALATVGIAARWRGAGPLPGLWRLLLLVAACAAIAATQPTIFGREAGGALLVSMLVLKYLETATVRDARLVVMVANFLAMAAFLRDQGLWLTLATGALLVLVLVALQWLRIDHVTSEAPFEPSVRDYRGPLREAVLTLLVAVPFAIACFTLFPRLGAPIWGGPDDDRGARIGIDDELDLGSLAGLALDDSPAFRVRFEKGGNAPPPAERYWRALVLWSFDGKVWRGSRRFAGREPDAQFDVLGDRYRYEITLADAPKLWRFALDAPVGAPAGLRLSADRQLTGVPGPHADRRYRVESATRYRSQRQLPADERAVALSLPAEGNPRARRLAGEWRARHAGDDAAIVRESLAMVQREFIYSLDPPPLDRDAIDDFLFDTRIGFCEHFASSFVFLMRAADVPARIVTGYQGGYLNSVGGYWLVRQSDAHAWAEVWFAGRGWVRVDPTASVAPERVLRDGYGYSGSGLAADWLRRADWWTGLRDRADFLSELWQQRVIRFDALRQQNLLRKFRLGETGRARHLLVWVTLVTAAIALGAALMAWIQRRPVSAWLSAYRYFTNRLARMGVVRKSSEGPADFAERAAHALPGVAEPIRAIALELIALRYAESAVAPAAEIVRLRAIRRMIRALRFRPDAT